MLKRETTSAREALHSPLRTWQQQRAAALPPTLPRSGRAGGLRTQGRGSVRAEPQAVCAGHGPGLFSAAKCRLQGRTPCQGAGHCHPTV